MRKPARHPNVCYAFGQSRRRNRARVIIAWLKLYLHLHVAGVCGPDERVSLRDVRMGGELRRYVGLPMKDSRHPFTEGVLVAAQPPHASRSNQTRPDTALLPHEGQAHGGLQMSPAP